MKLLELLPFLDLPGQRSLTIRPPIDLMVKQALARIESRPSRQWLDAVRDLEHGRVVRLEVNLEELALLLERVDFSSVTSTVGRTKCLICMELRFHSVTMARAPAKSSPAS